MRRWETLQPEFAKLGVEMVAISPDTVAQAAEMKRRHGLSMRLLADDALAVIDRYGVRHEKGFAPPHKGFVRPLAIPTTLLLDEGGVVRWIDQAEDYRVRSEASRVLGAVREALGAGAAAPAGAPVEGGPARPSPGERRSS